VVTIAPSATPTFLSVWTATPTAIATPRGGTESFSMSYLWIIAGLVLIGAGAAVLAFRRRTG
jgi:LPXTG-motif cell wall-anchored protein